MHVRTPRGPAQPQPCDTPAKQTWQRWQQKESDVDKGKPVENTYRKHTRCRSLSRRTNLRQRHKAETVSCSSCFLHVLLLHLFCFSHPRTPPLTLLLPHIMCRGEEWARGISNRCLTVPAACCRFNLLLPAALVL